MHATEKEGYVKICARRAENSSEPICNATKVCCVAAAFNSARSPGNFNRNRIIYLEMREQRNSQRGNHTRTATHTHEKMYTNY